MDQPNKSQEQIGPMTGRKPASSDAQGPQAKDVGSGTKHPVDVPSMPTGSEVTTGWRRRDYLWPEVHDAFDTEHEVVDPRAGGDPVGEKRDPGARP
jgi:hypothetical protein